MKVGDIVTRAYVWPGSLPIAGVIIEEYESTIQINEGADNTGFAYEEITFDVAWSDSIVTNEMMEELCYLEEVINESR